MSKTMVETITSLSSLNKGDKVTVTFKGVITDAESSEAGVRVGDDDSGDHSYHWIRANMLNSYDITREVKLPKEWPPRIGDVWGLTNSSSEYFFTAIEGDRDTVVGINDYGMELSLGRFLPEAMVLIHRRVK